MAEYCVDCWNKIVETNDPPRKFVLSRKRDLCEGCGQYKRVIVSVRRWYCFLEWWKGWRALRR